MSRSLACLAALLVASAVFAHQGVTNPAVMARMDGMSAIAAETKLLGEMAKGARAFDVEAAQAAARAIAAHGAEIPALFEAPETDPKSEALPAIWEDFASFEAAASALVTAAQAADLTTPEGLAPAVAAIGATCGACHKRFRE